MKVFSCNYVVNVSGTSSCNLIFEIFVLYYESSTRGGRSSILTVANLRVLRLRISLQQRIDQFEGAGTNRPIKTSKNPVPA